MATRVVQRSVLFRFHVVGAHRTREGAFLEVLRAIQRERGGIGVGALHAARVERHVSSLRAHVVHRITAFPHFVHELRSFPQPQSSGSVLLPVRRDVGEGYENGFHGRAPYDRLAGRIRRIGDEMDHTRQIRDKWRGTPFATTPFPLFKHIVDSLFTSLLEALPIRGLNRGKITHRRCVLDLARLRDGAC